MLPKRVITYPAPPEIEPSADFRVRIDGQDVFVYSCDVASYAIFALEGMAQVEIDVLFPFEKVQVRPFSRYHRREVEGSTIRLDLRGPTKLSIECDEELRRPLFLFVSAPDDDAPSSDDPNVRYFEGGTLHTPGMMELSSKETIYLAGGAVVRGAIRAEGQRKIAVRGHGVLDGSAWPHDPGSDRPHMLSFVDCRNVTVDGVTVADSPCWTLVPVGCERVRLRDVRIITSSANGDGIDIVGSRDVTVDDAFLRTKDDCIAIKAMTSRHPSGGRDVERVRVRGSVFWNAEWGNALEIGYETRCDSISDIVFEDCDVIHCEFEGYQSGGVFTIHNGDRATIRNVRYENIRVEDAREKLIDIKVLVAQYTRDNVRGQVRDIHFKDIRVVSGPFPVSIIRGLDGEHMIKNVTLENVSARRTAFKDANTARVVVELARGVTFRPGLDKSDYTDPCPCCDHLSISLGGSDICPICWWEDDRVDPDVPGDLDRRLTGGPNGVESLREARENYERAGSCDGTPRDTRVDTSDFPRVFRTPEPCIENGVHVDYYNTGAKYMERHFRNGELHGKRTHWGPDGTVRYVQHWRDGVKHGWEGSGEEQEGRLYVNGDIREIVVRLACLEDTHVWA
ncbi:hypothetical protein HQ560_13235, partial [bacterium]|nr:hypothetical protein [bacterium]